jgi:hypothetical protein
MIFNSPPFSLKKVQKSILIFYITSILICLIFPLVCIGQVGINTTNIDVSAALEVASTNKGVLFPSLTENQMNAISSPANGLMVFCSDCCGDGTGAPYYYTDSDWKSLNSDCEVVPCNPPTITAFSGNAHFSQVYTPLLIDGAVTLAEQQGLGTDTDDMRLHKDSEEDEILFEFPTDIPIGFTIELYFNDSEDPGDLGLSIRPLLNGIATGQSANTLPVALNGGTLVQNGNDFIFTRVLTAAINEIEVQSSTNRNHVIFLELKVYDDQGDEVPFVCL